MRRRSAWLRVLGVVAAVALVAGTIGFRLSAVTRVSAGPAGSPRSVSEFAAGTGTASRSAPPKATKAPTPAGRPAPTKKVPVPAAGSGKYSRADLNLKAKSGRGSLVRYAVRVEKGMPFPADASAQLIQQILNDKRSWAGSGQWRFELVSSPEKADLVAYIASGRTTDRLCYPLLTRSKVSCQNGNKVILNATRWGQGVAAYGDDLDNYRRYLVNHEFGHYLGKQHVKCPGKGRLAPVMMQQTKGLGGCRANAWPSPSRR